MARLVPSVGKIVVEIEQTPVYIKALTKKDDKKIEIEGILLKSGDKPIGYFKQKTVDGESLPPLKAEDFAVEFAEAKGMINEENPFDIEDIFKYEDIAVEMVDAYGGKVEV